MNGFNDVNIFSFNSKSIVINSPMSIMMSSTIVYCFALLLLDQSVCNRIMVVMIVQVKS